MKVRITMDLDWEIITDYYSFIFYFARYFTIALFFTVLILALFLIKREKSKLLKYALIFWIAVFILYVVSFVTELTQCSWGLFGTPSTCNLLGSIGRYCRNFITEYLDVISAFVLALEIDALLNKKER